MTTVAQEEQSMAFQFNIGFGQFTPHKKSLNYLVEGKSSSFEFSYESRKTDSIRFGLTGSVLNSGNPEIIGLAFGINGFTSLPITKKPQGIRLKVGIGVGYVEKIFDANDNNQNIAIGSHINAKITFRVEKELKLSERDRINIGLGVCHFSNGAYQAPNLGLNFLMANIGYSFIKTKAPSLEKPQPAKLDSKEWKYSAIISSGIRENVHPMREKYVIVNLSNRINYIRNSKNHFVSGVDVTYNPGIKHTADTALVISPIQSGIFIGNEVNYGPLTFAVDMGAYIFNQNLRSRLYHRFGVHYKLGEKLKILFQLKSHWAVAEAFELGLKFDIK